jgi:hypothetical protein
MMESLFQQMGTILNLLITINFNND